MCKFFPERQRSTDNKVLVRVAQGCIWSDRNATVGFVRENEINFGVEGRTVNIVCRKRNHLRETSRKAESFARGASVVVGRSSCAIQTAKPFMIVRIKVPENQDKTVFFQRLYVCKIFGERRKNRRVSRRWTIERANIDRA